MIFFGMLTFGWFYVYFFIPETKGLSLEEVDELYRANVKPWLSPGWKPTLVEKFHEQQHTQDVMEQHTDSKVSA